MSPVRWSGPLESLSASDRAALMDRATSTDETVRRRTAEIVARVRREGDAALLALASELDGVRLDSLEVPIERARVALEGLEPSLREGLERAQRNIAAAHRAFLPQAVELEVEPGVTVGRRPDPLGRVGVYAPGGRAAYPSSVLMGVVPAKIAGVSEVVLCSPPGPSGLPSEVVLAAAALSGVDRIFALGGAGAVAALAYGTDSVPRVDRIVGPGNAYVAEAKLQVSGVAAIDAPAGPSEILIIADGTASTEVLVRELLAQAEHDPMASVVLLTTEQAQVSETLRALERAVPEAPRREVIASALASRAAVLSVCSLDEAVAFSNAWAPEHLMLAVESPERLLKQVRNAGTVFCGASSSVAFGDYMTGANHVLPTGGLGRSWSGLSTLDFIRWTTYQRVAPSAAARLAETVGKLADSEGLFAHAAAARGWGSAAGAQGEREAATPLARAGWRDIPLYSPDRRPCEIDLSDNTNLFGVAPSVRKLLAELPDPVVTRYPPLYVDALKEALAEYLGVPPANIVTGCGSDDVLDSALRAIAEPGERLAHPDPSFAMVPIFARLNGLEPVAVPLGETGELDPTAFSATRAKLIYLCSPNNPTGTLAASDAVEEILAHAVGTVVIDEAYTEYAAKGSSWARRAVEGNLLVVRTLSKAFGLAGLRVGYAVGPEALVREVEKSRGPYKVNGIAARAAVAVLTEDRAWVEAGIATVLESRPRFVEALRALDLEPLPSEANFIFVPVRNAIAVAANMREKGVAVRAFEGLARWNEGLRISVGPWPMMEACLNALKRALR